MYQRPPFKTLQDRLREPRRFIQVVTGPRQVGKTTLVRQVTEQNSPPVHYASADEPSSQDREWIHIQWAQAHQLAADKANHLGAVLVLDEIQKAGNWAETIKRLWDEDSASQTPLKVVLLGSTPLLIQKELAETLAGRFELIPLTHWSYPEMNGAFGWTLDQFVYYGGYPASAELVNDHARWMGFMCDTLVETTLSRDVFLLNRVDKPALLRRLFHLGCQFSGQILPYQKMLARLHDAGNTTTLAHYLDLTSQVGMLVGIPKYAGQKERQRSSSPKWQVMNTALLSASQGVPLETARANPESWSRWTESAVGAHLVNGFLGTDVKIYYWRERNREVNFVLEKEGNLTAIEIQGSLGKTVLPGMAAFTKGFKPKRTLVIGNPGISLEEFLKNPASYWVAGKEV